MADKKFQSVDKVQHISGSSIMVADRYIGITRQVLCKYWLDKEKEFITDEFNDDSLVKVGQ